MNTNSLFSTVFSIGVCVLFSSCRPAGEDSWAHYQGGGMFVTATPSLSSDGQFLAYATPCTGHGDIYVIKAGANSPSRLTASDDFEASPIFAPDGKRIVYAREQNARRHIWIMNADGSAQTQLTEGSVLEDPLFISHDGRYLIFNRSKPSFGLGKQAHAYAMRLDKQNVDLISVGVAAVFSPDSKSVIYSDADKFWRLDLDADKKKRVQLNATGMPVDVSADGKWILIQRQPVAATEPMGYELWALNTDDNKEVGFGQTEGGTFLGTNSERILYSTNYAQRLFTTSVHGEAPARIQSDNSYKSSPRPVLGGRGAIMASYRPERSTADFKLLFINSQTAQVETIGSVNCDGTSFRSPLPEKPTEE